MAESKPGLVAAIGIGSNSARLLVAAREPGGQVTPRERLETVTRLASYEHGQGGEVRLSPAAINDTLQAAWGFASYARKVGAELLGVIATEAVRVASNRSQLTGPLEKEVGLPVSIISGEEEAALGWRAVASIYAEQGASLAVIDIGGGSTDLSLGPGGSDRPQSVLSLKGGSRTLMSRFDLDGATGPAHLRSVLASLSSEFLPQVKDLKPAPERAVAIGGTASVLIAIRGSSADDDFGEGDVPVSHGWLSGQLERLSALDPGERVRVGVPADRADVIVAGGAILLTLLDAWGLKEFQASQSNILDGFLLGSLPSGEPKVVE